MRTRVGIIGAVVSVAIALAVVALELPKGFRLLAAPFVGLSAFGFLQARANTCVAFVAQGIRVMGDSRKAAERVDDALDRALKAKAKKIYAQGLAITVAAVALLLLVP